MEEFPSGQRGQTVNLLRFASVVRIHPPPPHRSKLCIACSDLFYKSERAHAAAPPFQLRPALLGSQLVCRPKGGFFVCKRHIACDELFHFLLKLIARSFCCSSLPNRTCCRWAPVWGPSSFSPAFQFFVNSSNIEHLFYSWSSILLLSFSVNLFPSTFFLSQSGKLDLRPSSLPSISGRRTRSSKQKMPRRLKACGAFLFQFEKSLRSTSSLHQGPGRHRR